MYWLLQPTVIENTGMTSYRPTYQTAYQAASTEPEFHPESQILAKNDPPTVSTGFKPVRIETVRQSEAKPPKSSKKKSAGIIKRTPRERLAERQDHPFWGSSTTRGWF